MLGLKWIRPHQPFWLYADTFAYSLPFGWFWGRVGCFTAHDHIGQLSNFVLAVDFGNSQYASYYGGARHDLGLYEAIFVLLIAIVFFSVRKKELYQSSFAILFCLLYAPVRFWASFLRHRFAQSRHKMGGTHTGSVRLNPAFFCGAYSAESGGNRQRSSILQTDSGQSDPITDRSF